MDLKEAYCAWAPSYPSTAHNPLMRAEQAAMERLLALLASARALDVGTGSGRYLRLLRAAGIRTVVGLDLSWAMLTRDRTPAPRVHADARALPFASGAFDLVVASLMVGDIAELGAWAGEMARVLQPEGHLLFSDFHESWAADGWTRTFRASADRTVELPYHPRGVDEHVAALRAVGLVVTALVEPHLIDQGEPGVREFRRRWGDRPVAMVIQATRRGQILAARQERR